MNISKSSGLSATYENGELVNKKGFIINSNGENISLQIFNHDQLIREEDLMEMLTPCTQEPDVSLMDKLEKEFPTETLKEMKRNETKRKKKEKKRNEKERKRTKKERKKKRSNEKIK